MAATRSAIPEGLRQRAGVMARFFRGMDDPTRVLILELLLDGEKTVSELVELLGSPQGRVSTHLSCLRWCGYVATRREGRNIYYRLADDRVRALLRIAQDLMAEHARELLSCQVIDAEGAGRPVPRDRISRKRADVNHGRQRPGRATERPR